MSFIYNIYKWFVNTNKITLEQQKSILNNFDNNFDNNCIIINNKHNNSGLEYRLKQNLGLNSELKHENLELKHDLKQEDQNINMTNNIEYNCVIIENNSKNSLEILCNDIKQFKFKKTNKSCYPKKDNSLIFTQDDIINELKIKLKQPLKKVVIDNKKNIYPKKENTILDEIVNYKFNNRTTNNKFQF